jgi:hypothetical protein
VVKKKHLLGLIFPTQYWKFTTPQGWNFQWLPMEITNLTVNFFPTLTDIILNDWGMKYFKAVLINVQKT